MTEVINTQTAGSRLPSEVPWSGAQSGVGLKPDLEGIAGLSTSNLPPRPVRAKQHDAAFDHGVSAEGSLDGRINEKGEIPFL